MIKLYKKYHTAYWCIGIVLVTCMAIAMFMLWDAGWYYLFLIIILTILLVLVNGFIFTKLAAKKFTNEVTTLYNECQANRYLEALKSLFEKQAKGPVISLYNTLLAKGYGVIDDYDAVYECCQNIKSQAYRAERSKSMIDYYLSKDQLDLAQNGVEELKKITVKMKNQKYKETCENFIKNSEYAIRIKQGYYDGAEEFFKEMLATARPLYTLTKVSYSYALGKLLILKGEPERALDYLQVAYESGGDTKYKKFAEEKLKAAGFVNLK